MKKLFLFLICLAASASLALAQTRTVTGVVTSSDDGGPLPQLSVLIKGTTTGVVTDMKGKYTIKVPGKDAVLLFKYTGYENQEITVGDRTTINVVMKPALESIDEVMVVAYGTVKKQSMVGAQNNVTAKQLESRPLTNVANALAASAPGVQVTTEAGQPGSSGEIRVRGFGSINASSAPLIVVDGAVFDGALSDLNPQDIASISTLKDAASTALYGSSAGNGIILITTKSGSKSKGGNFIFTTNQGVSMRGGSLYETMGPEEWWTTRWQQWYNDYRYNQNFDPYQATLRANIEEIQAFQYQPFKGDIPYVLLSSTAGPRTKAVVVNTPSADPNVVLAPYLVTPDGSLSPAVTGLKWGDDLDWKDQLFRLGYRQEYILSGGYNTEKLRSYVSLSYTNDRGYLVNTGLERYTARVNSNYKINKWVSVGANLAYTRSHSTAPLMLGPYNANPLQFTTSIPPIYPIHAHNKDGSYVIIDGKKKYDYANGRPYLEKYNPIYQAGLDKSDVERDAFMARVNGEVRIMPWLTFRTNVAFDLTTPRDKVRYNKILGDQSPNGELNIQSRRFQSVTVNELLEFKKTYGLHEVSALVGHENHDTYNTGSFTEKKFAGVDGVDEFSNYIKITNATSFTNLYRKEGFFARVSYGYDNRYNASISYRLDGSSRFAPKKRWGNFWSVGFAWNADREQFMESTREWLNQLKLRFSIGQTGNDNLEAFFPYKTLFIFGSNNGSHPGLRFSALGNTDLVWEAQTSYDLAIDFRLWNRLNGTVEFFVKESSNLLFPFALPTSTGIGSVSRNIGRVRNYGIEFNLNADVLRIGDLRWNVNLNGTWMRNTIVRLPDINRKDGIEVSGFVKYMEGHSIFDHYLREFIGVDENTGLPIYRIDEELASGATGKVRVGTKGDSIHWTNDSRFAKRHFCGNSIPDLYGGFGTTLSWRGIDFSMQFAYQIGGMAYDGIYAGLATADISGVAAHKDLRKAWRKPGDKTRIPRLDAGPSLQWSNSASDRFLIDASSLMFRNVSLMYTLPQKWIAPLKGVTKIRIGVMAENLFLLSRRKGLNPMGSLSGNHFNEAYSFARTITGTVSINF